MGTKCSCGRQLLRVCGIGLGILLGVHGFKVFKIIHCYDNLQREDFFKLYSGSSRPSTRGHECRILKPHKGNSGFGK